MFGWLRKKTGQNSLPEVWDFPDAQTVARAAAAFVREMALVTIKQRGRCSLALSGGSTPRRLYELLPQGPARTVLAWPHLHFFFSDERCVSPDDARSNYLMAQESLLYRNEVLEDNVHRICGELGAEAAASAYEQELAGFFGVDSAGPPPVLDMVLLGMGDDGHTASLFPGHRALNETARWVVPVSFAGHSPKPDPLVDRVSFSLPLIAAARTVVVLVTGAAKAPALARVLQRRDQALPAARIAAANRLVWFVDHAARGQ